MLLLMLLCQMGVSEEELAGLEHVSATAAEVTTSVMRLKLDLAEKRRTVNMLQAALVRATRSH